MQIAYFVNRYPAISHTFVRREIQALERQGVKVSRFAARASGEDVISAEDREEYAKTRYLVSTGKITLAREITASIIAAPLRSLAALGAALRLSWRSEAGLVRHLIYYAEALALATALRKADIRQIHAHFGTNSATVAMLAARINRAGFSMTVHGPEEFDKPGLIGLQEKMNAACFTAAVSSYTVSQLRRLAPPALWDRIEVVRCGVDKAFFNHAPPPPPASKFVCVGRLSEQKGHITLVESAAILKRAGRDFSIALIGEGGMRAPIEDAIRRFDVGDRIELLGWRANGEVRAAIEGARALVLPSYAEGLPVAIMEAFSLARPVIATYIAGIPELVEAGENGWLVPAGDAEALAAAIAEALDAPDAEIAAKGEAGRARVAARHDIDEIASELKALFARHGEGR